MKPFLIYKIMKTLNFLIDMFKAVPENNQNALAIIKLQHLKNELLILTETLPNDMQLGEAVRKLLRDEN
jgi:hypothetical protein